MHTKGFSLVEFLLVIGVISLFFIFITLSFRVDQVEQASAKLMSSIIRTRELAITNVTNMECIVTREENTLVDGTTVYANYTLVISKHTGTFSTAPTLPTKSNPRVSFAETRKIELGDNTKIQITSNIPTGDVLPANSTYIEQTTNFGSFIFRFNKRGQLKVYNGTNVVAVTFLRVVDVLDDKKINTYSVNDFTGRIIRRE